MSQPPPRADDAWAWAHESSHDAAARVSPDDVTAVLVVHNASDWLPRTLAALSRLSVRPGRLIAVDAGSTDASRRVLDRGVRQGLVDAIVDGQADAGFGANVALGLDGLETTAWLWLLHDDAEPLADCLDVLLETAAADPAPDVLVPKLLYPRRRNYPDRIAEVGQSLSQTGRRIMSVVPGDIDQHQDDAGPTLGGSTAGMFVRRAVWDDLGGFDPALPLFADGLDFGWRANDAGLRVVTCPRAGLHHRRAGRHGERQQAITSRPATLARTLSLRLATARSRRPGSATVWALFVALLRAIGYLLGKAPSLAADEVRAAWALVTHRHDVAVLRERAGGASRSEHLRPGRLAGAVHAVDRTAGAFTDRFRELREDSGTSLDELTGDDWSGEQRRNRWLTPWLAMTLAALVVGVVSVRNLLASGRLVGPGLFPAPASLSTAWDAWWQATPGLPGANAPWLGLTALGSTLTFGQPDWFALVWLTFGPLFAAWSAHRFARHVVPGWGAALVALAWGLALPLTGALGRGSLAGVLLAVLLPVLARSVQLWLARRGGGVDALRAPAVAALCLAALAACWPLAWLAGVVAASVAVRARRRRWPGLVVIALGPLLVVAPWLPRLWRDPARLLTGPDPLAARVGDAVAGSPAPAAMVAFCALAVGAVVAVRGRASRIALALATLGVTSLAASAWLPKLVVTLDGLPVRPDPTPWRLLAAACLMGLGTLASRRVPEGKAQLALVSGLVAVLLAGGAWAAASGLEGLSRSRSVVPAHVQLAMGAPRHARVLLLDTSQGASWNVVSDTSPQWGSGEADPTGLTAAEATSASEIATAFATGESSDDLGARLTSLGVSHVWVGDQRPDDIASLANSAGLTQASVAGGATLWLVTPSVSRTLAEPRGQGWAVWEVAGLALLLLLAAPSARSPLGPRRPEQVGGRHG